MEAQDKDKIFGGQKYFFSSPQRDFSFFIETYKALYRTVQNVRQYLEFNSCTVQLIFFTADNF